MSPHGSRRKAAFNIVAASLETRDAFKIVTCFLHHGNSKACSLHLTFLACKN